MVQFIHLIWKCEGVNVMAIINNPINKPLVARFLASVDPARMPNSTTALEDLDSMEVDEIREQALGVEYEGVPTYIVPGPIQNGKYTLLSYEFHPQTWKLSNSKYTFTFKALSNLLEHLKWNGGKWVSQKDINAAMKRIPE